MNSHITEYEYESEMLDKLEAADTNWEVNVLIEPYEGVMELR